VSVNPSFNSKYTQITALQIGN